MNIKDYLLFYLGCKMVLNDDMIWILSGVHIYYIVLDGGAYGVIKVTDYYTIKPILRPLSDMTEEEQNILHLIKDEMTEDDYHNCELEIYAAMINKCRNWHIDVDGLIDAGLAIDKTTLK